MEKKILELEREKLKRTLEIIKEELIKEKEDLTDIENNFIGDKGIYQSLVNSKNIHIKNLKTSLDNPYFARIDFKDTSNNVNKVYIGKNGVMQNTDIVITDWRAPISSLYYDSEVGDCSFTSPEGIVKGRMDLKRQYEIDKGKLIEYFDVDLVANDSLLQKYLNSNNDTRLKSIISTIQKEQNMVIRKNLTDDLIIQGVAGSGKTTVALHRIAYLVYNYMNSIKQNQYLVIGPNKVFLKYIQSVLPDLDVSGVSQLTFEQYATNYIDEKINIDSSDKKVNAHIGNKDNTDIDKFKCSLKYLKMLNYFINDYFTSLTEKPLLLGDFEILPQKKIKEIFESTDTEYSDDLSIRVSLTIDRLRRLIEDNKNELITKYTTYSYLQFKKAKNDKEKDEMRKKFAKERIELNKNCTSLLRKYFSKSKVNATKLYKTFISNIEKYNLDNYMYLDILKKNTLQNIKKSTYDFEDLAALIYIKSLISKDKSYGMIRQVVIDEAQDLGEFNFYVLRKTLYNATFSIFGDLAQSIYDYRGIDNWSEVNETMFANKGEIINFNKSYRTTREIMEVADDVAESIGLTRSDLVVRQGNEVLFDKIDNKEDIPSYIADKITEYKNNGYKTIAVISKTNLLSNYINDDLYDLGVKIPNVSVNDDLTDERFNICTISNQLAKGLEFDAVIINNASEEIYSSSSNMDMKLLYVAVTRALHELDIVYSGNITKPLEEKAKIKVKK